MFVGCFVFTWLWFSAVVMPLVFSLLLGTNKDSYHDVLPLSLTVMISTRLIVAILQNWIELITENIPILHTAIWAHGTFIFSFLVRFDTCPDWQALFVFFQMKQNKPQFESCLFASPVSQKDEIRLLSVWCWSRCSSEQCPINRHPM